MTETPRRDVDVGLVEPAHFRREPPGPAAQKSSEPKGLNHRGPDTVSDPGRGTRESWIGVTRMLVTSCVTQPLLALDAVRSILKINARN